MVKYRHGRVIWNTHLFITCIIIIIIIIIIFHLFYLFIFHFITLSLWAFMLRIQINWLLKYTCTGEQ